MRSLHKEDIPLLEKYASNTFGISLDRIKSRERSNPVVRVRFIIWRALREEVYMSYPAIQAIYGKDHTTIMHGVKQARDPFGKINGQYERFIATFMDSLPNRVQPVDILGVVGDKITKRDISAGSCPLQSTTYHHVTPKEADIINDILVEPVRTKHP